MKFEKFSQGTSIRQFTNLIKMIFDSISETYLVSIKKLTVKFVWETWKL